MLTVHAAVVYLLIKEPTTPPWVWIAYAGLVLLGAIGEKLMKEIQR